MGSLSNAALEGFHAACRDFHKAKGPIALDRIRPMFEALPAAELKSVEQEMIFHLRELMKVAEHPIYQGAMLTSWDETVVFFARIFDWISDDRLIDATLVTKTDQWAEALRFKHEIRVAMAQVSPQEYRRHFGHEVAERRKWNADEAATARIWRRIGFGMVLMLIAIAALAKWLSP